jgi:hypothetical protein
MSSPPLSDTFVREYENPNRGMRQEITDKEMYMEALEDLFSIPTRKIEQWERAGNTKAIQKFANKQAKARIVFAAFLATFLVIAGVLATIIFNYTIPNSIPVEIESVCRALASISAILGIGMVTWTAYEGIAIDNGRAISVANINGIAEWKSAAKTGAEWMLVFTTLGFVFTAAPLILEGIYIVADGETTVDSAQEAQFNGVYYSAVGFTGLAFIFWAVVAAATASMKGWAAKTK